MMTVNLENWFISNFSCAGPSLAAYLALRIRRIQPFVQNGKIGDFVTRARDRARATPLP